MSILPWYTPHVKTMLSFLEKVTVIRIVTPHIDRDFLLGSTSGCLIARQNHTKEARKYIELTPSESLVNKPGYLNHLELSMSNLSLTFQALTQHFHRSRLTSALQPLRQRTKNQQKLYGAGRKPESEGGRSLSGPQNAHDVQGFSGSPETFEGYAKSVKNIPKRIRRYRYSKSWHWSKPVGESPTHGSKRDGSLESLNTTKPTRKEFTSTRRKKEKPDSLLIQFEISSDEDETSLLLICKLQTPSRVHAPAVWNLRTGREVKNLQHMNRRGLHRVSSECPITTNHFKNASPQRYSEHSSSLSNDQRNHSRHDWGETVNHNWPADAVSINHEEIRIATPRGEDEEGRKAHGNFHCTKLIRLMASENSVAQTACGLEEHTSEKNRYSCWSWRNLQGSTRRAEDRLRSIPDIQILTNHATRGVEAFKALYNANGSEKTTESVMSWLGTVSIRIPEKREKSYKLPRPKLRAGQRQKTTPTYSPMRGPECHGTHFCLRKLFQTKYTLPIGQPSIKNYTRESAITEPNEAGTIIRNSDELTRNEFEDKNHKTTPSCAPKHIAKDLHWRDLEETHEETQDVSSRS